MLETNGTLVAALRAEPAVAHLREHGREAAERRRRAGRPDVQRHFLDAAVGSGVITWVKIVIGPDTDPGEFDGAIAMVADGGRASSATRRDTTPAEVFLQPVTPFGRSGDRPRRPEQVLELQERALAAYPRVRVVPQTHKAIGQL